MISDDEIMQAFSISDSEGYWKLLDSYCSYVYAIVSSHVRGLASEQDKEECIADIFIETVNACRKQNIDSLKAVVSSIAKRKSIDLFRKLSGKNRYSSYMEEITDEPADYDTPETFSAGRTEKENLWNEVKKLGEPDSDILILQFFYDKTAKEIGNILKMTAEAVTKRSQRARQKLRKILTESEVI
ncbi:MAG: sigma-70 family RNA polymerase sigma factor [Oscillospiraceae bacterium]|nr:sigma-70 family RNA polymerase sigma factor [Oscillospiraceae bacterium]MDD6082882.1 sigma-70 family RNA polymerase sigma factor [Oscillospiraceae bacterium]